MIMNANPRHTGYHAVVRLFSRHLPTDVFDEAFDMLSRELLLTPFTRVWLSVFNIGSIPAIYLGRGFCYSLSTMLHTSKMPSHTIACYN